nr:MAG TPA: hypothetical protein [Caudoviricetes sp.]
MSLLPSLVVKGVSISSSITIKRKNVIAFYIIFP